MTGAPPRVGAAGGHGCVYTITLTNTDHQTPNMSGPIICGRRQQFVSVQQCAIRERAECRKVGDRAAISWERQTADLLS